MILSLFDDDNNQNEQIKNEIITDVSTMMSHSIEVDHLFCIASIWLMYNYKQKNKNLQTRC